MKFDKLNSMEIDRSRNVEIISLMKGYATFFNEIAYNLHNAGFIDSDTAKRQTIDTLIFVYRSSYCWVFARITNV